MSDYIQRATDAARQAIRDAHGSAAVIYAEETAKDAEAVGRAVAPIIESEVNKARTDQTRKIMAHLDSLPDNADERIALHLIEIRERIKSEFLKEKT